MIKLDEIDESRLLDYTYKEAEEVLEALEEECISNLNGADDIAKLEYYIFIADCLRCCAKDKTFSDLDYKKKNTASKLSIITSRLVSVISSFEFYIRLNNSSINAQKDVNETLKKFETDIDSKIECVKQKATDFDTAINTILEEEKNKREELLKDFQKKLQEKENAFQEKLQETERSVLTHVFTLLGVFSAVIVTIMSVVITSSSWLNSTGGSGAIMALVVSVGIIIIAITVLLSLVYFMIEAKAGNKCFPKLFGFCAGATIVIIGCLIGWLSYLQDKEWKTVHIRYVLEDKEYTVKEDCEGNKQYRIVIDEQEYILDYDEKLLHDGELYFCEKHKTLE